MGVMDNILYMNTRTIRTFTHSYNHIGTHTYNMIKYYIVTQLNNTD